MCLLLLLPLLLNAFRMEKKESLLETWILQHRIESFTKMKGEAAVVILDALTSESIFIFNENLAGERGFPPGSLVKIFSSAMLHIQGKMEQSFSCRGKYYPPGEILTDEDSRIFHLPRDAKKNRYFRCSLRRGHGTCNLEKALMVSCNTYFLTSAEKNRDLVEQTAELWDLDMISKKWHDRLRGSGEFHVTSFRKQASVLGEGGLLLFSPLEVGRLYRRFLTSPEETKKRIPDDTRRFLLEGLKRVVQEGTLKKLVSNNREIDLIGGKTGTATWFGERYRTHGWNVIFFRYRKSNYILVTFVMRGSGGGAARELSEIVLNHLKIRRINSFDR